MGKVLNFFQVEKKILITCFKMETRQLTRGASNKLVNVYCRELS